MGAEDTVDVLERLVERRGQAPKLIRCDNGREFIPQSLRDWCRFNHAGTGYIEPGADEQAFFIEQCELDAEWRCRSVDGAVRHSF
jgi:putative transposase